MKRLAHIQLDDVTAERANRQHHEAITEIQQLPVVGMRISSDVSLANGIATAIPHRLNRVPTTWKFGALRSAVSAGFIVENSRDAQYLTLTASGYGATITVDIEVM